MLGIFFPSLFHMRILRVTQSSFIDLAIIWDEKLAHLRATNTSLLLIVFFYNHGKFHLKREKITHELENTRTTRTDSQQPNESRCEYRFTVAFECFFRFLYTESDISVVLTVKTARELRECQRVGVEVLLRKCLRSYSEIHKFFVLKILFCFLLEIKSFYCLTSFTIIMTII